MNLTTTSHVGIPFYNLRTLKDIKLAGTSVLLRADLDVLPITTASPAARLTSIKKTVDYILAQGATKIIIIGHIGRPQKRDALLSTKLLVSELETILGMPVAFADDFKKLPNEKVVVFENVRFWEGETNKEVSIREKFAKSLASMGSVYINDAFAVCHRNNASVTDLATFLPSAAGLQVEKEVAMFEQVFQRPKKGFVAIIGGAKIETKLPVIERLLSIAEYILVGGLLPLEIQKKGIKLPKNVLVANLAKNTPDIDEESAITFAKIIQRPQTSTIVWNGPMGVFENKESCIGTDIIARAILHAIKKNNAFSVAGGGETETYLRRENLREAFTHVSNGGGASLEFLSGNILPALKPLQNIQK